VIAIAQCFLVFTILFASHANNSLLRIFYWFNYTLLFLYSLVKSCHGGVVNFSSRQEVVIANLLTAVSLLHFSKLRTCAVG